MHNCLEDVLFWDNTLHVFDQVIGFVGLIILKVIDDEVESCLWNYVYQWWKNLQSILSTSEHHKVVSQEIIVLEYVTGSG